jgi:hypothetical protein
LLLIFIENLNCYVIQEGDIYEVTKGIKLFAMRE